MNADFTPELGNYTDLKPFRYWCQKVLPAVYDDSLSYYELLCKVVDYLNKTMEDVGTLHEDVEELHSAYVGLQNYVNNYFDNLDVQEEINNKLDKMAIDGSLSTLIQPLFNMYKTDIDSEVNTQNEKINVLENRMNTFSSLPIGSTTGDAELIDIRVPASGFNNNTPYATAGESVRGQVNTLHSVIKDFNNTDILKYNDKLPYGDTTSDYVWIYSDIIIPIGNYITVTVNKKEFYHKIDVLVLRKDNLEVIFKQRDTSALNEVIFNCGAYPFETLIGISYIPSAVLTGAGQTIKRSTNVDAKIGDKLILTEWSSNILAFSISINYKNISDNIIKDVSILNTKLNNFYTVNQNGRGDYVKINDCVQNCPQGSTILVYPGVYEETIEAFYKEIHLIGLDKNNTIIVSKDGRYEYPALNCSCGSFSNITFLAKYEKGTSNEIPLGTAPGAYAVHCENGNGSDFASGKKLSFYNCLMISDFFSAFGCGCISDWSLELNNCQLIINQPENRSQYINAGSLGALFIHDPASGNTGVSNVKIKNCTFENKQLKNTMCIYDTNRNGNSVNFELINNVLYSHIAKFGESIWWRGIDTPFAGNLHLMGISYGNSERELNSSTY